jgi:IS5 family transposase
MSDEPNVSDGEQDAERRKTRREVFLDEMDQVVPWAALEAVIEPFYPRAGKVGIRARFARCCAFL